MKYYKAEDVIRAIEEMQNGYNGWSDTYDKAQIIGVLEELPAIEVSEDCISRQQAIEALTEWETEPLDEDIVRTLENLPPVIPTEPLTDKEQRIFLAAMDREEKVCKQVDDECRDCREPYEDSLVRICHEIVRKVKGALWTI